MFLYPLPLLFVYACAPSLTNRPYTVFTYLTSLHSLYTRGLAICLSSAGCSAEYTGFLVRVLVRVRGGGCLPPFTVSVNVYIRLTHVFLSIHYYAIIFYIVSVYMQAADCTIGFLLYLDAYHLP